MDERTTIDYLEELAERFGIKIRYETIDLGEEAAYVAGGLCWLRGEYEIIINSRSGMKERIKTLAEALKHFNLDQVYIKPAAREILDRVPSPLIGLKAIEAGEDVQEDSNDKR